MSSFFWLRIVSLIAADGKLRARLDAQAPARGKGSEISEEQRAKYFRRYDLLPDGGLGCSVLPHPQLPLDAAEARAAAALYPGEGL